MCRFGAGKEVTKNECDTPGFELQEEPRLITQAKKITIELPRNHRRIVQSSVPMLQSWRANCDVKILLYDTDPMKPDVNTISRVTDYVVSYSCKGNATMIEERFMSKNFVEKFTELTDDKNGLSTLMCVLMNKLNSSRIIPLQEVTVILLGLSLVECTESFDHVSFFTKRLSTTVSRQKPWRDRYSQRDESEEDLSFSQFFHKHKNNIPSGNLKDWKDSGKDPQSPKFVLHVPGTCCVPSYPPSPEFARAILMLHKPWRKAHEFSRSSMVYDFERLMNKLKQLHLGCNVQYEQAMDTFYSSFGVRREATAAPVHTHPENMSDEERMLELLTSRASGGDNDKETDSGTDLNLGLEYDWGSTAPIPGVSVK